MTLEQGLGDPRRAARWRSLSSFLVFIREHHLPITGRALLGKSMGWLVFEHVWEGDLEHGLLGRRWESYSVPCEGRRKSSSNPPDSSGWAPCGRRGAGTSGAPLVSKNTKRAVSFVRTVIGGAGAGSAALGSRSSKRAPRAHKRLELIALGWIG